MKNGRNTNTNTGMHTVPTNRNANRDNNCNKNNDNDSNSESAEHRMAALLLLARGRAPSWSARSHLQQQQQQQQAEEAEAHHQTKLQQQKQKQQQKRTATTVVTVVTYIFYLWTIAVAAKVLLAVPPSAVYKSTDFFVHRHWKAVTRTLPVRQWYTDDRHVTTVHTLDYPPGFALWEFLLSSSGGGAAAVAFAKRRSGNHSSSSSIDNDKDDDDSHRCLALKADATAYATTSPSCVAYMRGTVIFPSDVLWWLGAYAIAAAAAAAVSKSTRTTTAAAADTTTTNNNKTAAIPAKILPLFLLLVFHPALLWLDHVHFQYNGMLLGILLISLSCLMRANSNNGMTTKMMKNSSQPTTATSSEHHFNHLAAAAAFSLLLTLKHLYLTNSLWYAVYLLRRYCCYSSKNSRESSTTIMAKAARQRQLCFSWQRFLALTVVSGTVLAAPCAVFVGAIYAESPSSTLFWPALASWMTQLIRRLFPFGRGLVHSYWAGNVWALYTAATKVLTFLATLTRSNVWMQLLMAQTSVVPIVVPPSITAVCMLVAQWPGLQLAWHAAAERSNAKLLQSFTLTSLAAFLFQYHAHEKAILTALVPCTVWAVVVVAEGDGATRQRQQQQQNTELEQRRPSTNRNTDDGNDTTASCQAWALLWDFTALSLLGLFPILFRPQELMLKVCSYVAYLAVLQCLSPTPPATTQNCSYTRSDWIGFICVVTIVQLEVLAPLGFFGRFEFVPLGVTSLVCASGFLLLFARLCYFTAPNSANNNNSQH